MEASPSTSAAAFSATEPDAQVLQDDVDPPAGSLTSNSTVNNEQVQKWKISKTVKALKMLILQWQPYIHSPQTTFSSIHGKTYGHIHLLVVDFKRKSKYIIPKWT